MCKARNLFDQFGVYLLQRIDGNEHRIFYYTKREPNLLKDAYFFFVGLLKWKIHFKKQKVLGYV